MTRRLALAVAVLTCPVGQACSPLVYELASETRPSTDGPASDGADATTDAVTTGPDDPGTTQPPDPTGTGVLPTCDDGAVNGGESDLDCGGPCPPCQPGQKCDDPKDCAFGLCQAGVCGKPGGCFGPQDCPPPPACMLAFCEQGGACQLMPDLDGTPCDDGDACTITRCLAGECTPTDKLDCSKLDGPCRTGVCNPQSGTCAVEWPFEGEPCKDEGGCNFAAKCEEGECVGPPPFPPLLFTDFSVAGGWTAEPPWQIGPAIASACSPKQADDPASDHSPSADGHVAGAAIGDCLPVDPFNRSCIESPVIDAFVPGELWLSYWAVLNNAGAPMVSTVEVFDFKLADWVPLVVIDQFVAEPTWTEHSHELTPFISPGLRVRFCHQSDGPSVAVGGWSIDDLTIGPPECGP